MTTRKVQTFVSLENFRVIQDEAIRQRRSIRAVCSDALSAYATRVEARQGEYENESRPMGPSRNGGAAVRVSRGRRRGV